MAANWQGNRPWISSLKLSNISATTAPRNFRQSPHTTIGSKKINWDAIGAIGEILGAIGVIVSVAYLAVQIRKNTQSMNASITTAYMETGMQQLGPLAEHRQVAHLVRIGMEAPEELDADDSFQFAATLGRMVFAWEGLFNLYEQNALSEDRWEAAKADVRSVLGSPGGRAYWANHRIGWGPTFRDQVDDILTDSGPSFDTVAWNVKRKQ